MKVKQYPGRAVLVCDEVGLESKNKMEVMYESSWKDFDWKSEPTKLYTNYTDWLQDSSDSNSESEESVNRYVAGYYQNYPSHYYSGKKNLKNGYHNSTSNGRSNQDCLSDLGLVVLNSVEQNKRQEDKSKSSKKGGGIRRNNEKLNGKDISESCSNVYENNETERLRLMQTNNRNGNVKTEAIHQRNKNTKLEKLIARNGGHDLDRKEPSNNEFDPPKDNENDYNVFETYQNVRRFDGPHKSTITYSKSMRSLKEGSENVEARTNLKHSKSMRSLKNRDSQRSNKNPSAEKFSSNSIRKLLKIPEILRTSSGSLNKKESEIEPQTISSSRGKVLIKGFENPEMFNDDSPEQRLTRLLINSKPSTAAYPVLEEPPKLLQTEGFYSDPGQWSREDERGDDLEKVSDSEVSKRLNEYYSKNSKEGKSLFKTLTLRLKKRMINKDKATAPPSLTISDEYVRAGLYSRQNSTEVPSYEVKSKETLSKDPDFAIPRPKLIVPVHTYGIRKRRTGNMMYSTRTRSDDTSVCSGDAKKLHHTSCPGRSLLHLALVEGTT